MLLLGVLTDVHALIFWPTDNNIPFFVGLKCTCDMVHVLKTIAKVEGTSYLTSDLNLGMAVFPFLFPHGGELEFYRHLATTP